ncbi:MAG: glycosyltransferase family 4 protein [Muribaculaceae bacterium]|nr:glycosyltransferase family 4 protein [Muribaculaceae bacterium]
MKILYVASGTGMSGGATKSILAMLREADKAGIEYEVVCPDEAGLSKHLRELGKTVHVVSYRHTCLPLTNGWKNKAKWLPRLVHNAWINYKGKKGVTEVARRFRPDIIHENSSAIDVGYVAAKSIGVPDIIHIREYGDLDFKMKLPGRERRLEDKDVYTISITQDIARHLKQDSNPKSKQIYNGIVSANQFRYTPYKKPYFLYAGRIEEAKGVGELICAFIAYAGRSKNPLKLLLAGGTNFPEYQESLQRSIDKAGVSSLVEWLGERSDVDELMYEAAATIIPSRFEALGRVMPEAMANGSICIGRNTGGTKEQMDRYLQFSGRDTAFRFETTQQLTMLMMEVESAMRKTSSFEAGGGFHSMITDSQKAVEHYFSEGNFGKQLIGFYDRIMTDFKDKQ